MAISSLLQAVVEYAHILSAMGWLGGGILTTLVVGPNLPKLPPQAALAFNARVLPKMVRFVQMMVGSTLLFGILLLYVWTGGDMSILTSSPAGMTLSAGVSLALVSGIIAAGVTLPSFSKVSRLSAAALESGQAPPPEMMKYARRARMGAVVTLLLLLVVLGAMVAAGF